MKAVAWSMAENVGVVGSGGWFGRWTKTLGGDEYCHYEWCDSFNYITCEERTPNYDYYKSQAGIKIRFDKPMFDGFYLDIYLLAFEDGKYAGQKAANSFCRWKGFDYATDFEYWLNVGETMAIGDGEKCNAWYCDAFEYIECENQKSPA